MAALRDMPRSGQQWRRKPLLVNVTWVAVGLLGLAALYVLSYAPVVKATGRGDQFIYRPCLWLYADSPATEPLMEWASAWGDEVEVSILIAELETIPSGGTAFK
jgi:hypothetical protein